MQKSSLFFFLVLVPALVACGPKNSELLLENKAFNDELLAKMQPLTTAILFMPITPQSSCQAPDKLVYAPKSDTGNTDYVMYDELTRVGKSAEDAKGELTFYFHEGLMPSYLKWIDPIHQYYLDRPGNGKLRSTPLLRDTFRRVKNIKYLVVVKPRPIDRARGEVLIDTYLVDLKAMKPVCGFSVTAKADPSLGVKHYDVVRRNRRTGAEKVVRSDSTDQFQSAIWSISRSLVFSAVNKQLLLDTPK